MSTELIPHEIVAAYYADGISASEPISGGHINTTLLVTDTIGEKFVLQRINHSDSDATAEDYEVVSAHLQREGWEIAQARKTVTGSTYIRDNFGKLWRSFNHIESETIDDTEASTEAYVALGGLLGKLHRDLSRLDYRPRNVITPYREVRHFGERLPALIPQMPDEATRELAANVAKAAAANPIDDSQRQLIHGDPRMANALCREGKPFTFIDWDGLALDTPFFDIGDLVQSVSKTVIRPEHDFSMTDLHDLLAAYYQEAEVSLPEEEFTRLALAAGRSIALCLGMRCLIDSVEDYYFGWEGSGFDSRKEFNLHRANRQWAVYQALSA